MICVIDCILSILFGIWLAVIAKQLTDSAFAAVLAFLLVAASGCVLAYLATLLLHAFGEMVENTALTHADVEDILKETRSKK